MSSTPFPRDPFPTPTSTPITCDTSSIPNTRASPFYSSLYSYQSQVLQEQSVALPLTLHFPFTPLPPHLPQKLASDLRPLLRSPATHPKGAFLALICGTWLGDGTLGPSFLHGTPSSSRSLIWLLPLPTSLHNPGPPHTPMDDDLWAPEDLPLLGTAPRCPSPGNLDRPRPPAPGLPSLALCDQHSTLGVDSSPL